MGSGAEYSEPFPRAGHFKFKDKIFVGIKKSNALQSLMTIHP